MNRKPLLVGIALAFVVTMAFFYRSGLQPAAQPEAEVASTKPAPAPATGSVPKKKRPPTARSNKKPKLKPTRNSSSLRLDTDSEEVWSPTMNRVEGTVVDQRGRPLAGTSIVYTADGKRRKLTSNSKGSFEFQVSAKKIAIRAERKAGLIKVRSEEFVIDGSSGGDWEVDLVLEQTEHGGLGVGVAKHRLGLRIRSVVRGGPADELGLKKDDVIIEVGGTTVAGFDVPKVSQMLIGPTGTTETIRIRHKDGDEVDYTFRRAPITKR
ncbi:MAG: PDZ domain-containing protein [Myxococcota bacterium]|nr:PDZ domain-containing protein [Myxococcota bacterium]